jgi:hypothetical protein
MPTIAVIDDNDRLLKMVGAMLEDADYTRAITIGYEILDWKESFALTVDGEEMSLRISERLDRIPHIPTPKEEADLRRWEADKLIRQKNGTYYGDWSKPRVPETDHVPSGLLMFGIDEGRGSTPCAAWPRSTCPPRRPVSRISS